MRAALYARYSTDMQSAASIPDQLRDARRHAERLGAEVVAEFSDAAISGSSMANRPGLMDLLAAARAGAFDLVVAEHTERLARKGSPVWAIYEDLTQTLGIPIETVHQGRITALLVGMAATMTAVGMEELGLKTWRGLEGVVRSGRSAGGLTYGYRMVRRLDGRGELVRGLREIDPGQAAVVVRILTDYAAGRSPLAIVTALNAEGVPGPSGGLWGVTTVSGNAARGNGVLHNRLYIGETVWGRHRWVKDRESGKRRARAGDPARQVAVQDEALRICSDELWEKVRARHAAVSCAARGGRPNGARRPARLLSGLIRCGVCEGPMTLSGPKATLRCAARATKGASACANGRNPAYAGVEARVMAAVRANLLHPVAVEQAIAGYQAAKAQTRRAARGRRAALEKAAAEVARRTERLWDQVETGELRGREAQPRLDALAARAGELAAALEALEAPELARAANVVDHPSTPGRFRQLLERLTAALAAEGLAQLQAREAFRTLVAEVRLTPLDAFGQYSLEILGDLAPILRMKDGSAYRPKMGAGTRAALDPTPELPFRMAG